MHDDDDHADVSGDDEGQQHLHQLFIMVLDII